MAQAQATAFAKVLRQRDQDSDGLYRRQNLLSSAIDALTGDESTAATTTSAGLNTPRTTPGASDASTTTPDASTTPDPSSSTTPADSTTPAESSTTPVPSSTSTTPAESSTPETSRTSTTDAPSSTTPAPGTTVTQIITPSTVITIGTSTITSALDPTTLTSASSLASSGADSSSSTASLSSGARAGIIAGSTIGGVLAIAAVVMLCLVAKRRKRRAEDDAIRWPEIASSAEDRAALYPEQVHQTGRAGIGGDEMEEVGGGHGGGGAMLGAGAAGVGAAAYGGNGRWASQSSGRQPTLPAVPPSIYSSEGDHSYPYGGTASTPYTNSSAYTGYSNQGSTQSHAPLAPGPASIEYQRAAAAERNTPSPPRLGGGSSNGHDAPAGSGALPLPGTDLGHEEIERPASPTDMQVGGAFGHGYDEADGGKRWRLSVVNDDPREH